MSENTNENTAPVKISRSEAIDKMPKQFESAYLKIDDGQNISGIYDGIYEVSLQDMPNRDPTDTRNTGNVLSMLLSPLEEGGEMEQQYFWASNGLIKELELYEVNEGDKISIKRIGEKLNTKWIIRFIQ